MWLSSFWLSSFGLSSFILSSSVLESLEQWLWALLFVWSCCAVACFFWLAFSVEDVSQREEDI